MSLPPLFLWHNDVHDRWVDEQLVFFFFSYEPRYNRETAVQDAIALMEEHNVLSYQVYEATAPYDIIVRAWLPQNVRLPQLKRALMDTSENGRTVPHVFAVADIVHHWPFAKRGQGAAVGEMDRPSATDLALPRPGRERELLNQLQVRDPAKGLRGLDRATLELYRGYEGEGLLRRPNYRGGIRFMVLIKLSGGNNQNHLKRRLLEILNRSKSVIHDPSIYQLDDVNHPFLIFGHVTERPRQFHRISERVVSEINDMIGVGTARTYTSFFPLPGFLACRDDLRLPPDAAPAPEPPIEDLLEQPEGHRLEIKATAWTEVGGWLLGRVPEARRAPKPVTARDNDALNSLLRAIAALLNTEGGHIIVGLAERAQYGGNERFEALPKADDAGEHRIYGLESTEALVSDIPPGGAWDQFLMTLWDVIDHRFEPAPSRSTLRIRRSKVNDKLLCILDVGLPDEFFRVKLGNRGGTGLRSTYIVRMDNKTRELKTQAEVTRHEQRTPRASRKANGG